MKIQNCAPRCKWTLRTAETEKEAGDMLPGSEKCFLCRAEQPADGLFMCGGYDTACGGMCLGDGRCRYAVPGISFDTENGRSAAALKDGISAVFREENGKEVFCGAYTGENAASEWQKTDGTGNVRG